MRRTSCFACLLFLMCFSVSAQEKNVQSSFNGFNWASSPSVVEQKIIEKGGVIFSVSDNSISASMDYFGEEVIIFFQFNKARLYMAVVIYSCSVDTYIKKYKQVNALLSSQFGAGTIIGFTSNWKPFNNIKVRSQISSDDQTVSIWYTNTEYGE